MEGKPTWTETLDMWLRDWLIVTRQNGCRSRFKEPHQECLINVHSEEADLGLKSCRQGCFHFTSQLDDCVKSCRVTAGGKVCGVGVWLCFICCPLQGGSNLQPTREPVDPKPVCFWTWTLRNFSVLTSDWAGLWHYQLDSYQMKLQVFSTMDPICVGSVKSGIWSGALRQGRG